MVDKLKAVLAQVLEFWNKYSNKQKTLIISIAAGVIVAIGLLWVIFNQVKYEKLAVFETTADTAEATGLLDENGSIPYEVTDDGLTLSVDKDKVAEARLILGQNGVGDSSSDEYNKLFDTDFTTTDSERRLKEKLYMQDNIAASIESIDGVKAAGVTINIPDETTSIYKTEDQSFASIMLTTTSDFSDESVDGIASFVANQLGSSNTDNIRIVDQTGKLLFAGNSGSGSSSTASLTLKDKVVNDMEASIRTLLINAGVYNDAEVMANLDINLDEESVLDTQYYTNQDDDSGPLDSKYTYLAENVDGTGGVVGTDSNGSEITDTTIADAGAGNSTVTVYRDEYSTSSTVTDTKKAIGTVNTGTSSVAIILNKYVYYDEATMDANGDLKGTTFAKFQAKNSEKKTIEVDESVYTIVQMATGIKSNNIQILAYEVPVFYPKEASDVKTYLPIGLAVFIFALLVFVVIKGMKPVEITELEPELSVEALLATTKENQTLDDIEFSDKSATRQQIEKFVDENPEAVASLLRNWLNDEWE